MKHEIEIQKLALLWKKPILLDRDKAHVFKDRTQLVLFVFRRSSNYYTISKLEAIDRIVDYFNVEAFGRIKSFSMLLKNAYHHDRDLFSDEKPNVLDIVAFKYKDTLRIGRVEKIDRYMTNPYFVLTHDGDEFTVDNAMLLKNYPKYLRA